MQGLRSDEEGALCSDRQDSETLRGSQWRASWRLLGIKNLGRKKIYMMVLTRLALHGTQPAAVALRVSTSLCGRPLQRSVTRAAIALRGQKILARQKGHRHREIAPSAASEPASERRRGTGVFEARAPTGRSPRREPCFVLLCPALVFPGRSDLFCLWPVSATTCTRHLSPRPVIRTPHSTASDGISRGLVKDAIFARRGCCCSSTSAFLLRNTAGLAEIPNPGCVLASSHSDDQRPTTNQRPSNST
ncbi:hypothetical protein B0H67DRAFT_344632 [Lasiosphaeris hirsuta]|uniref:Uncharacterized protein n=1 Tax=Lasiosphaeris hirsuta TaxID=260670 RepID=A0AA40A3L9_9PEZI|nr:hypothetical protein B0H67DRAFT_344632 [Lasiosphaeris hirsuta]